MLQGHLFKVKKDKITIWREWSATIMKRKEEVLETLREEGEILEGGFDFTIGEDIFVILFAYSTEQIKQATEREINELHRKIKRECLESIGPVSQNYFIIDKLN